MSIKVAINGFGRIGHLTLRRIVKTEGIGVTAVNDLTPAEMLLRLLKYDSTQGHFQGAVGLKEDAVVVDGKEIKVFTKPNPEGLPWGELGADVALECTGLFTSKAEAEVHIRAGTHKVVISAPGGNDMKAIVYGVDRNTPGGGEAAISTTSCATNCSAPMAAVLQRESGIVEDLMTTIHAFTGDQNALDVPHHKGDLRRVRAASLSIVPNSTGTAKAIGLVIPRLNGKLGSSAQRIPMTTGSLTELVSVLERPVTKEEINAAMEAAVSGSCSYTEEQLISSDVIGVEEGSLFDATQTRVINVSDRQLVKTVAWYDNEMSYTCQLACTLRYFTTKI